MASRADPGIGRVRVKDPETERPIPTAWRSTIKGVVDALARRDYHIESGVPGVAPVSHETAAQMERYIADYGEVLTELPDQSWDSSVCIWMGSSWDFLVDLWAESEGRSDLVLSGSVVEAGDGFLLHLHSVHVP